jgi:hypothetical protein
MAFSYSALNNYGRATLPSVDTWGTNMNILRDPPRSITTRRIDKVGETSSITEMIDDSGNRACEAINVYARGVNPFVSVSYSNHGNNGGQRSGGISDGGISQAFLPYTVAKDGAFRPPVIMPEELIPLSRQPRVWTKALSNPGFPMFNKRIKNCGTAETTREVKSSVLQGCVRPTATYKIQTPIVEPFEVKYVIQPNIKVSGHSGIRTMDRTTQHVKIPTKEIERNKILAFAKSNLKGDKYVNNSKLETDRYTQDINTSEVVSNPASNINVTPIENLGNNKITTKNTHHTNYQVPKSIGEKTNYIHQKIGLTRKLPEHQAVTNISDPTIYRRNQHNNSLELKRNTPLTTFTSNITAKGDELKSSRQYNLAPKIQPGGYEGRASVPMKNRMRNVVSVDSDKARMAHKISEQFQHRFTH